MYCRSVTAVANDLIHIEQEVRQHYFIIPSLSVLILTKIWEAFRDQFVPGH